MKKKLRIYFPDKSTPKYFILFFIDYFHFLAMSTNYGHKNVVDESARKLVAVITGGNS